MGKHLRGRGIYELDDNGHVKKAWGHMLMDAQEPYKSFEATYTLKKGGTKETKQ